MCQEIEFVFDTFHSGMFSFHRRPREFLYRLVRGMQ